MTFFNFSANLNVLCCGDMGIHLRLDLLQYDIHAALAQLVEHLTCK